MLLYTHRNTQHNFPAFLIPNIHNHLQYDINSQPGGTFHLKFGRLSKTQAQSCLFNTRFEHCQIGNIIQYKSYMDKGYRTDTHAVAAYHINVNTPEIHSIANAVMTGQRIGVE